jgi:hypothetical protein
MSLRIKQAGGDAGAWRAGWNVCQTYRQARAVTGFIADAQSR